MQMAQTHSARDHRRNSRKAFHIARQVSATIGSEFFSAMVKHLALALEADGVYVGEFTGGRVERLRTLAAWVDGSAHSFEYDLAGSASAQIALGRKPLLCRANAQTRFAADQVLASLGAEACAGVPLLASGGHPVGVLMAVYRNPVPSLQLAKSLLDVFAPRAAAELERKQEEERLCETAQRYRAFIATNEDGMWRVEFEQLISTEMSQQEQMDRIFESGYIAECNDAFARQLGREKGRQLIGCRLAELTPLANESIRDATLHAIRSGYRFTRVETSPVNAEGNRRHMLRTQWGIVENGFLQRIWGITRDITELKHVEQALDASERRMADLLESLNLVVVMLQTDGTVAFCNKHLYRLTGWGPSEVIGRNWLDLMIPPEQRSRAQAALAAAKLGSEVPTHHESYLQGPNGRRWWIAWDSTALRDAEGSIVALANVGRDITEFKALEAQLYQAQKLESIGRLAGGVAHDFNNLLTVIMGYSGVLLANRGPSDPAYDGLIEIRKAAEKGASLTDHLLAFGRRQVFRPELLNLTALIADDEPMIRRLIGEGEGVELILNLDPSVGLVRADAGQLHQILLNLVLNARDAMPQGGKLIISTSKHEASSQDSQVSGVAAGPYVELTVADTGTGMTEEVRQHLFEPFYTTKEQGKGTGLGLSTVYGIVQQNGGHIAVETEPGNGTCFTIHLPGAVGESASARESAPTGTMPSGTGTILLVEDQQEVRTLSAAILRSLGYSVLEAGNSEQALQEARAYKKIDLLLTDVVMPRTTGVELADTLKASHPGLKVLFMSGYSDLPRVEKKTAEAGFAYLHKPFSPLALAIKVREILDRP